MSGMFEDGPDGSTPIDPDEANDLLPQHLHNRAELNSWEQANILVAAEWVQRTRKRALEEPTIRALHRRMFDQTWGWAGKYRESDKNIGVFWGQVPTEVSLQSLNQCNCLAFSAQNFSGSFIDST